MADTPKFLRKTSDGQIFNATRELLKTMEKDGGFEPYEFPVAVEEKPVSKKTVTKAKKEEVEDDA